MLVNTSWTMEREHPNQRHSIHWIHGDLTREIIAAFFTVYNALGYGLLESVYVNALSIELRARGQRVAREVPIEVRYLDQIAGRFRLDMVVDDRVLIECKATEILTPAARPQVFNYLRCSSYPVALLFHFGPTPKHYRFVKPEILPATKRPNKTGTRADRNE